MMIFHVFKGAALALCLAFSAQAATMQRRQALSEAARCIKSFKEVTGLASEINNMVISKALSDLAAITPSVTTKEGQLAQKITDTLQICCPNNKTSVYSNTDAESLTSVVEQFSIRMLALVSDFNTRRNLYSSIPLGGPSEAFFRSVEGTTSSLFSCTVEKAPGKSSQLKEKMTQIDAALSNAASAENRGS